MSPEHEKHLDLLVRNANYLMKRKYRAGQSEHGGNLWEMAFDELLDNAISEALDQVVYLLTLKQQLTELKSFEEEQMNATG